MSNFNLLDVSGIIASYGRGIVFYANKWDTVSPLTMVQLGSTEGDITITPNSSTAGLTLPELTGPAVHDFDYLGESPKVEIPLYLADPALIAICSPSGSNAAGRSRRGPVKEYTLWIVPEILFLSTNEAGIVDDQHTLAFDGSGVWTIDGQPLNDTQVQQLGNSFWMWRAVFDRPVRHFKGGAGDAKKNIETVSTVAMHHPDLIEGHHLYTSGDPFVAGIDLNGMS